MQPQARDLRQEGLRRIRMSYAHGQREGCLSLDMIAGNYRIKKQPATFEFQFASQIIIFVWFLKD
jgi:hypothetical protein